MSDVGNTPAMATVNGLYVALPVDPSTKLSAFLRETLFLRGTKIGCSTGDCGVCTVLVDEEEVCACLTPVAQIAGCSIVTAEGIVDRTLVGRRLHKAFRDHQAVQCGFCTPGFLTAATALLTRYPKPSDQQIDEALAGVLCRCTGYRKIASAVREAAYGGGVSVSASLSQSGGNSVGRPVTRLDIAGRLDGSEAFGADAIPHDALRIRAIRSPHHHARFELGDIEAFKRAHDGVVAVLTARDIPGRNLHGVHGAFADQPLLCESEVRHRGEAIAIIVGSSDALEALDPESFPVRWTQLDAQLTVEQSTRPGAKLLHADRPGNVLIRGLVERGDVDDALSHAAVVVEGEFSTSFVEHAYLEPEAGWAEVRDEVVEIHSCTQAPWSHRADLALILGIPEASVRVIATGVGGGFGGKLDLTVQPYLALAAWLLRKTVGMVYDRAESIATSTKRHPAHIRSRMGADENGIIVGVDFEGDFNTGAYASWGTAVANRVPVHAGGPYFIRNYRARARAIHTHVTPAGAFRGFGVPQTVVAQEQMVDELAERLGIDQLEFRLLNAIRVGQSISTGQHLDESVGMVHCLEALLPRWTKAKALAEEFNRGGGRVRRGVGLAAFFYGCGNTALSNPSTIRFGIRPDGLPVLHQGAVDAGQGANTVIPQIAADALGVRLDDLVYVGADTHVTPDCGRTSASRQTFVTGAAAVAAGRALRAAILARANVGEDARLEIIGEGYIQLREGGECHKLDLSSMAVDEFGYVFRGEETFDPPSTSLDAKGQGRPYAVYAFGAQIAEVEVDLELGCVKVLNFTAAHDVGRMVNPTLLAGQIEGAVAQGIGLALMEQFIPGRTETFHDYLIPTAADVPPIETIFVEQATSLGPFGAKGIGEPALVPTAAAILNAIKNATGCRICNVPATPDVILSALGILKGE